MSVQSEITRLENAKTAIKAAIEGKGVTVPSGTLLDGMAALIDAIEAGGVGDSIKIDAGTFTPAENVNTYQVSIQIDNVVLQALMPNVDAAGLSFIPLNSAGCYFGYNIPNFPSRMVTCNFSGASNNGVMLVSSLGGYAHIVRPLWSSINDAPLSKNFKYPLGEGLNYAYFKFLAGVEYMWFRIGY